QTVACNECDEGRPERQPIRCVETPAPCEGPDELPQAAEQNDCDEADAQPLDAVKHSAGPGDAHRPRKQQRPGTRGQTGPDSDPGRCRHRLPPCRASTMPSRRTMSMVAGSVRIATSAALSWRNRVLIWRNAASGYPG